MVLFVDVVFFLMADYVILHAAEPLPLPQRDAFWREPSPAHQLVFEERHLRHISLLGKVSTLLRHWRAALLNTLNLN